MMADMVLEFSNSYIITCVIAKYSRVMLQRKVGHGTHDETVCLFPCIVSHVTRLCSAVHSFIPFG